MHLLEATLRKLKAVPCKPLSKAEEEAHINSSL